MTGSVRGMRRAPCRRAAAWTGGIVALAALGAAAPAEVRAQVEVAEPIPPPTWVVEAGRFDRSDFHGEGGSSLWGLRVRLPLGSVFLIEPAARYTSFEPDPGGGVVLDDPAADEGPVEDVKLLVVEFGVQAQLHLDRFRPYVGVGAGGAVDFRDERGDDEFLMSAFSAGGGLAWDATPSLVLLAEARLRGLDGVDVRALEMSFGVGWQL